MLLSQTVLVCDTLNNIYTSTESCLIYGVFNLVGVTFGTLVLYIIGLTLYRALNPALS